MPSLNGVYFLSLAARKQVNEEDIEKLMYAPLRLFSCEKDFHPAYVLAPQSQSDQNGLQDEKQK